MHTTEFFAHLHTVEDIKAHYRILAMQHHPDRGGDLETMQHINAQYQDALKRCSGQTEGERTYTYRADIEQELMEKLLELLKLRGLDVALIGLWLWVTGDTRNNREALKAAGLLWHRERLCWYYKPQGWKRRAKRSSASLDELAAKYGCRTFQTADEEHLPARR